MRERRHHFWLKQTCILLLAFLQLGFTLKGITKPIRQSSIPLTGAITKNIPIRVLLDHQDEFSIRVKSYVSAYERESNAFLATFVTKKLKVSITSNGISLNGDVHKNKLIRLKSSDGKYWFDKRLYQGSLILWHRNDTIYVINEVPLEQYLKGVVPSEMFKEWHPEALKAQAVASRTYALFTILEEPDAKFHLRSTTASQVYEGELKSPRTDKAIAETSGEVLTHNGNLFPAFFHSTCGGHTTYPENVWYIIPSPALQPVECTEDSASKHYKWKAKIKAREIEEVIRKEGFEIGQVIDFKVAEEDGYGRAISFDVVTAIDTFNFHANPMRIALGPFRVKSTLLTIKKKGDTYHLKGQGWGHGVGMVQWGVKGMAEKGIGYEDILKHYYTGVEIQTLSA